MVLRKLFGGKKETPPRCSAVIVAGGSSLRMGTDKLEAVLGKESVLLRTLRVFQNSELVEEIVLVTREDKLEQTAALVHDSGLSKVSKVICGGKTRAESALAGVSEVDRKAELIAIHDAARPLVTEDVILRAVYAARDYGAAVPVVKSPDTLKSVDSKGFVTGTVDRESTVRVQTPQVFKAELIKGALTKAVREGLPITDDCAAVELLGVKCRTVLGDEDNLKLTSPRDMLLAQAILKDRGDWL